MKRESRPRRRNRGRMQTIPKEPLAQEIRRLIAERGLSRVAAAAVVNQAASQISVIFSGQLHGYSSDRLLSVLLGLGRDVDIVIRPAADGRRTGRLRVAARE